MADLMRISGVGEEYSELLEAANCNTIKQLRRRNPDNLATLMQGQGGQLGSVAFE